ncbi:MAG: hypothetical protein K0R63_1054 [Rickettsiales bacterium]|jgi:uncharacterized protein YajQ (UPF0234 family)|nr:hypothetical protein [Rickettsiales bacterium]
MPSFDIVCKTDVQEVDNAVNSVVREIENRYDFKGSDCKVEFDKKGEISVTASDNYKLSAIQDMLKGHITRRSLDPKVLEFKEPEKAFGSSVRQKVIIRQGVEQEIAKQIVKEIKGMKTKVQASIRGDELRVEGKKRDDLQEVMQLVKSLGLDVPFQFINFRD